MTFTAKIFPYSNRFLELNLRVSSFIRRERTAVDHKFLHNYANVTQFASSVMAIEWKFGSPEFPFILENILYA